MNSPYQLMQKIASDFSEKHARVRTLFGEANGSNEGWSLLSILIQEQVTGGHGYS